MPLTFCWPRFEPVLVMASHVLALVLSDRIHVTLAGVFFHGEIWSGLMKEELQGGYALFGREKRISANSTFEQKK